jgi:hypothetical protein
MDKIGPAGLAIALALGGQAQGQTPDPPAATPTAQTGRPAPPPTAKLDASARQAIVAQAAKALRDGYVEPEVSERAAARIEHALAAGAYDSLESPAAFAQRLTADLAEVTHDKHLRIAAPGSPPPTGAPTAPPPDSDSGVVRADRLAGDIGYLEVIGFPPPEAFKAAIDRSMQALSGTRALIIDMRRNGGGSPPGVAYLVSFFVPGAAPVHVMNMMWRIPGTTQYRTDPTFTSPTPTSYLGKPIYVLTSPRTFSGGEEFCYDMQALKLAVLVGETTGGGANPGMGRPLASGLTMFLPAGKGVSAVTGGNWEGVGVKPDIAAPTDQALKVALEKLGQTPKSSEIGELSQASLFQMREAPLPGTEAALRRMIESAAAGKPDFDMLAPGFADIVRSQASMLAPRIVALGPIQSIKFLGPGMMGDRFEVTYAKGAQIWSLVLTSDGKVGGALFGPAPPAAPAPTPSPAAR